MLFFDNNLHFLLDILHTALPSQNTCQIHNETLQIYFHYQTQLHLPNIQQNFAENFSFLQVTDNEKDKYQIIKSDEKCQKCQNHSPDAQQFCCKWTKRTDRMTNGNKSDFLRGMIKVYKAKVYESYES